jgi:hypothetical protein
MPRYRMLEVNWDALNGQKVTIEKSSSYVILVTRDGALVKIGQAMRERPAKSPDGLMASRVDEALAALNGDDVETPVEE